MKLSDLDSYAEGKILAGCIDLTTWDASSIKSFYPIFAAIFFHIFIYEFA